MARTLKVITEARRCTICAGGLPYGPHPLLQGSKQSRIVLIGQAPGRKAHDTGIPWDDASGQRLREWLNVTHEQFYDPALFALMPMGFCYPGTGKSGDLPPRPECAPEWHPRLLKAMPDIQLTILIGRYALDRYLPGRYKAITAAVKDHKKLLPTQIALPHPSPRNNIWLKKNAWFEREVLPALRKQARRIVTAS